MASGERDSLTAAIAPGRSMPDVPVPEVPMIDSRTLFGGRTEIVIAHADSFYRLKITRQGKLILNK